MCWQGPEGEQAAVLGLQGTPAHQEASQSLTCQQGKDPIQPEEWVD